MEYVIGIILLLSFFGLAHYCIRGHDLMIGSLMITAVQIVLPLVGIILASQVFTEVNPALQFGIGTDTKLASILNKILQSAPKGWGTILVNVCWSAWFGRVLMGTGIAPILVRKTAKLGGDKPMVTIALLNIITALIFAVMTGVGPVIAIGVAVLPILMSLGVPKAITMFSFMESVAAGIYLNPVSLAQYRAFYITPDEMPEFTLGWYAAHWGYAALIIMLVVTTVLAAVYLKKSKTVHSWAAQSRNSSPGQKNAPMYTLILPIVPVVLKIWLDFSVTGGFIIAGPLALFLCGRTKGSFRENCRLVNKLYYDGVVDTASLIGSPLTLSMFNQVAIYASLYFKAILGNVMPKSESAVCIIFAVLLSVGLLRGPMILAGCGAATLGVLPNVTSFSVSSLYGVPAIPTITANIGSCITQSWVAWGLVYTKVGFRDFLRLSIPNSYLTDVIQYIAVLILLGGLGAVWLI